MAEKFRSHGGEKEITGCALTNRGKLFWPLSRRRLLQIRSSTEAEMFVRLFPAVGVMEEENGGLESNHGVQIVVILLGSQERWGVMWSCPA